MTHQPELIPMVGGEALRLRRESLDLSVEEAALILKCNPALLECIEREEPLDMAPVYRRGFLRGYARLLELSDEDTGQLLLSYTEDDPEVRTIYSERAPVQSSDRWLKVASYVMATLLVGTLAWQMTHEAVRLASVASNNPATNSASPITSEAPASHVNASIAALETLGESRPGPTTGNTGDVVASAWATLSRNEAISDLPEGAHRLTLETSADSWIEISDGDGTQLEQDLVRGGDTREYVGAGPFAISLGRSSAVRLYLDGEPVDFADQTNDDVTRLLLHGPESPGNEIDRTD